jgi:hypothetical protein
MLRLVRLERRRRRLRLLSTLIPHHFGLCRRSSSSNLGFLDHIRRRH